jgi:signal transduction histidine kinase/HAMP domain-containing protein
MRILFSLLTSYPYIDFPYQGVGWLAWLGLFLLVIGAVWWSWERGTTQGTKSFWMLTAAGLLITPFTTRFIGIQLPAQFTSPVPDLPQETNSVVMLLAAIPWVMAGGILGPLPAALIGAASGFFTGLWLTHSPFTCLETAGLAVLFSVMVRQRFRTRLFHLLRSPLAAAVLLAVFYAPVYILTAFFNTHGSLAVRIDYSFTQTWMFMLTKACELIFAGIWAEIFSRKLEPYWGRSSLLEPSPIERSLELRLLITTAPIIILLMVTLLISDWIVAGRAAERTIRDRLSNATQMAADSLPYFLETGQSLIQNLAEEIDMTQSGNVLQTTLATQIRAVPYFNELYVFDADGKGLTGYPEASFTKIHLAPEEISGIKLAIKGVPTQTYVTKSIQIENTAQVSFLAVVKDSQSKTIGVLLGRTDLNSNPFTQPAIEALESVKEIGGEGVILDENHRILFHSRYNWVMDPYTGKIPDTESFYSDTTSNGARKLAYFREVVGRPWSVILSIPAEQSQKTALDIAIPLLIVLVALSFIMIGVLRFSLKSVASSLQGLAQEAALIADGQLDHRLANPSLDEVGRFSSSFEQMRLSLKARMEEQTTLLAVSQGVAANLEAGNALKPVLEAVVTGEISSARVAFMKDFILGIGSDQPVEYSAGPRAEQYAYLDPQILELMRGQQEMQAIPNTARVRRLKFAAECAVPGAIIAWPLIHEDQYYGTLWAAYDETHVFTGEETRFLSTLAGQAALAATNARLYASAEIGRQRLEAVLTSTPEPVLVVDEEMHLLLLNPAAMQVPDLVTSAAPGQLIKDVIGLPGLLDMLLAPIEEEGVITRELAHSNGRIYSASVSPVQVEGRQMGKIAMLQDISHYKQLDQLKSEFVSTVSHDLRSPLTLMRGYATMLQLVGELNEQQKGYVTKITSGVENMSRLVNNLLDLGRIDAGIGLKIERISTRQVIDRVVNLLMPQANQKSIQVTIAGKDGKNPEAGEATDIMVEADSALLEQALYNLVENAIKYTSVGGQVAILCQFHPEGVQFEVKDSGIGIAPLDLPHVFEKFYRSGRREASQQRGTGLGLAIVKSIVERHHGRIWVDSSLGRGSSFYITIPLYQDEQAGQRAETLN